MILFLQIILGIGVTILIGGCIVGAIWTFRKEN